MNNKELNELLEYNQEYMEARLSEDVFGGDYTSEVELKYLKKDYDKLQSNWNSLRECIEENKKVAMEYTKKIELSGLCQGDYPVEYYYAIKRIDLDNLYLDKMNELEGKDKE